MPKPKLLIIPSWYPHPGDEINGSFFQEQAQLLSETYDVRVLYIKFSWRPPVKFFSRSILSWFRYWGGGVSKVDLPPREVFQSPPLYAWRASAIGITKSIKVKKRLKRYVELMRRMRKEGWVPDLIHAHSVYCGGLAAAKIKTEFSTPFLITEHSPFSLAQYPKKIRKMVSRSFEEADLVLSLSNDKVRQVCMSGIDIERNLIYNLVDERRFNDVCAPYKAGDVLKLISIGAASHFKDHKTLIRALVELKRRSVPFELTLVGLKVWGGGRLYDEIIELIFTEGLGDNIKVVDQVERFEVNALLAKHHVFVMTSVAEGFPVSVLEAWATGLFVVATRHGGTEDLINKRVGALVEVKDHEHIASCLEELYGRGLPARPNDIREYIVSICGADAFARRQAEYYQKVLGMSAD